ncbi:sulfurtransferase [Chitinibacter bivalviorum]|uniref:Sulfurtransferase n=1 Tax=Chitinibacter bivalviorum TaxID=2739434 RepID=A0A7H9BG42_9NEIS|nr:sulfurtransferase [Chitinibacter bivalviorum]QLG87216.1 sulfurtransferase [Chitinibacter bivalviorum]
MKPLISAAELKTILPQDNLVIVDCRHDLANVDAGRAAYLAGHIPGARFLHLDEDLSAPKNGRNGRHPLPNAASLALKLGGLGITKNTHVVAYDASGGPFAARLWWLLRWLGAENVQVLDGGVAAWLAAGGDMVSELAPITPTEFVASPNDALHVSADEVLANIAVPQFQIVDARTAERFVGVGETLDPAGGHIPEAANRFFMLNLQDGYFKSADVLREEWVVLLGELSPDELVHQCGSGVTACHNLLALEVAGMPGGRLYAGSWSEWCSDPTRPVEK